MAHKSAIACLPLTLTYATHTLEGEVCGAKIGIGKLSSSDAEGPLQRLGRCHFRNLEFAARLQNKMAVLRVDYLTI